MLMHTGMTLTLFRTDPACRCANIQHASNNIFFRPGSPSANTPGDVADVGAIQIKTNTLGEVVYGVFGDACISTRSAYLGTRIAFLYAAD